jgi:predicted RecB family endonuclease
MALAKASEKARIRGLRPDIIARTVKAKADRSAAPLLASGDLSV